MLGMQPRKAAWQILQLVAAGAYSDVALNKVFSRTELSPLDKRLTTEIAFGAIRQRYYLDCWIDYLGKISALKQPPLLRWLLHIGLYQILFMDRIPSGAIVNTSVELSKKSNFAKLSVVVNGILRAAVRAKEEGIDLPTPKDDANRIAQNSSLPVWLANDLICWAGKEKAQIIAKAFNQSPPIDLRINTLKSNQAEIKQNLLDYGISSDEISNCPNGLQVKTTAGDIRNWPGYKEGKWCVQDRSSQWVAPLLDPQPNERILDVCSAPGGKSTHIAELIHDRGEVWAVDRSRKRLNKVIINAERLGLNCLNFLQADCCDLLQLKPDWRNYFQKILIDAPCSGLGTLARNPDARWRVSPSMISELIVLQRKILESVLPLLAPGGRIVYSTCTINPSENFSQINWFLKQNRKLILRKENQMWPSLSDLGDGFYGAVIDYL